MNKGRKFVVNATGWDDSGPGSGAPPGQVWLKSDDGNWYAVSMTGAAGAASISINQTPLSWIDPGGQAFGYILVNNESDNTPYKVTLSGSAGAVTIQVEPNPWPNLADKIPYLFLQSPTSGLYYTVGVSGSAPATPILKVYQNATSSITYGR